MPGVLSLVTPRPHFTIPLPDGRSLHLGPRTLVMAIVNVTPDSFADGADILDIGGESTRPGAAPLSIDDELARVEPVLEGLRGRVAVPLSIDTYKAAVAERAIDLGASIVNDISALVYEPALAEVVARRGAAVVLMHNRGRSSEMYAEARYGDVVADVRQELAARVAAAERAGISRDRIIVDPGLGFAKKAEHTLRALAGLPGLAELGLPILSGPSRKSFMKPALGDCPPAERVWGTAAAVAASVLLGAHIVRVHDVREMVQVVRVADAIATA